MITSNQIEYAEIIEKGFRIGNPPIRVWPEVWGLYRKFCRKFKLKIGDLASIILLYAPLLTPFPIVVGLIENYDIDLEKATALSLELRKEAEEVLHVKEKIQERIKDLSLNPYAKQRLRKPGVHEPLYRIIYELKKS